MNNHHKSIATIFSLFIIFNIGFTNVYGQSVREIKLQDAIEIGLNQSKMLAIGKEKIKAADARIDEVKASRLPALKFLTGYTRLSDVPPFIVSLPFPGTTPFTIAPVILDNYVMKLSAAQPLFTGFKLENLEESAMYASKAASSDFDKDKLELISMIKIQYWNLVKAKQFMMVASENVAMLKVHEQDIQKLQKVGMAQLSDLLKIQVQLSEAEYRVIEAKNQMQLAMLGLNNTLRLPLETQLEAIDNPKEIMVEIPLQTMVDKAFSVRPDLKASELRVKAGETQVNVAKSSWYPQVSAFAEYNYNNPNMRIVPARSQFDQTWSAGIQVSMDLWNWGLNSAQSRQAEAQLAQAMDASALTREAIHIEVMQSYTLMKQAVDKIPVTESSIKQAEEQVRVMNAKFASGNAIMTDILDAETALLAAKMNRVQAVIDLEIAKVKLEKSIGITL
ncbi:MAG: TolC family protein [Candidatus Kapaibacteriota bacterium]